MNNKQGIFLPLFALPAFGLALTLSLPHPAQAQQSLPPRASTAPAAYRLGTDDVLSIQVINFPELCVPQVTVPSDGRITVPVLGSLPVAGQTTSAVAKTLTQRWSKYVVGPLVTVTLTQRRKESVQVYGFVTHVQPVEYRPDLHLTQALAEAGGAADNGDLSQVSVTHADKTQQTVDVSSAATAEASGQDLLLAPDDDIYVPERHIQISVLGEVAKPGSYNYKPKMTVLDALQDADNVNQATADLSNATLLHDGTERPLDLKALLVQGRLAGNATLSPGDRIYIPELHNRVYVDGAVGHPGYYAFKPGDRLVDAINGCGGTLAGTSDLAKVSVIHQDKLHNTASAQTVNFGEFLQKANLADNVPLVPDDAIYVPIKGKHTGLGEVLQSLIGVGAVASGARGL